MNEYHVIGHRVQGVADIIQAESEDEARRVFSERYSGIQIDQVTSKPSADQDECGVPAKPIHPLQPMVHAARLDHPETPEDGSPE